MLVTVIAEKQYEVAKQKIEDIAELTDAIELRLDYLENLDLAEVKKLNAFISIPVIFTLRKKSQGGFFSASEDERKQFLEQLAALNPEFIDLEYDVPISFAQTLKNNYPTVQLIRSYHDFNETSDNLSEIFNGLQHEAFSIYKIVSFANSTLDCVKMLNFVKESSQKHRISGFCMGELGIPSRILGPIVGNALHYVCIEANKQIAPGQIDISTFLNVYRFRTLNQETQIYALLGNPVDKSIGHLFHNHSFKQLNKNAVYVKFCLHENELIAFFETIKTLPFYGFSITMPLKQAVIPFLDNIAETAAKMQSVNTILMRGNKLYGDNTDAKGALDAIENKVAVADKTILILGAGGAARAIGYEAIQRKAKVIFLNRTASKVHALVREMYCSGYGFEEVTTKKYSSAKSIIDYDILINTTPLGMAGYQEILPIPESLLRANTIVMDTIYNPRMTPLLIEAKKYNCILVYGEEMFVNQAMQQLQLWFGNCVLGMAEKFNLSDSHFCHNI